MRNVWKGLIIGGLTGAAAGLALDGLNWGAVTAGALGERAIQQAPDVASKVRDSVGHVVADNAGRVQGADLSGRVKNVTAFQSDKLREAAADGIERLGAAASRGRDVAEHALAETTAKVDAATGRDH